MDKGDLVGYQLCYQDVRVIFELFVDWKIGPKGDSGLYANQQSLAVQLGIAFLWGYALIHYYLDSKIWRVRRDPSVSKALRMD